MPGRGTEPGPALYPECGKPGGPFRHRKEKTRTCAGCRKVQREAMHRYRIQQIVQGPSMVPALGLTRRVHALARMGWGQREVGERLGMTGWALNKITHQVEVRRETAEKIKIVYAEMAWQDGPNYLARAFAEKKGWPGPMDWDDPDNPDEVPACVIESAHREALAIEQSRRRNAVRRADPGKRRRERARQADRRRLTQQGVPEEMAVAT